MLIACVATVARAQTVSYDAPTVNRTPNGGTDLRQKNPATLYYISHDDCVNNQAFVLPMSVSAPTELEVFASSTADCSNPSTREFAGTGGPGGCTPITSYTCSATTCNLTLYAQELVYEVLQTDCDGNPTSSTGSTSGAGGAGGSSASSATSTTSSGALVAAGVPLTLFFTFTTNTDTSCLGIGSGSGGGGTTGVVPGICASWSTSVLLVPPAPPTGLTLGTGEGELAVELPTGTTPPNGGGYYVFCAPYSDTSSVTDAGSDAGTGGTATGAAGGAGGSAASPSQCPPGTAFPVTTPNIGPPYMCAGPILYAAPVKFSRLGDGRSLVDDERYVVAVASFDEVYNVGPLSTPLCDSPQQTNTILDQYCSDGGSGCGGCWIRDVGTSNPVGPVLALVALGGVAVVARRDRRQKRRRRRRQARA